MMTKSGDFGNASSGAEKDANHPFGRCAQSAAALRQWLDAGNRCVLRVDFWVGIDLKPLKRNPTDLRRQRRVCVQFILNERPIFFGFPDVTHKKDQPCEVFVSAVSRCLHQVPLCHEASMSKGWVSYRSH